ncbi:TPA: hypothetical protein MH622_19385 [Klebsiella pneumoniae]|jgi:hypothetical protein|nr:hypothetical protein B5L94_26865 [Klebsiella pneumoniae]PXI56035.1 hypothetical protein DMP51_17265 [Klebsiella pneumoniae]RRZ70224.1 hypothetical protein EGK39_23835 [Klebsiella oxytoca]HBX6104407.1 hypothetical protein [Klebsiella pneumoniae]HBX6199767.1 hypothetical protein [Klebsiella pneumoniae]
MENYQRKRLQPLAFLVIGLVLIPLAIAPATQMIAPAISKPRPAPATTTQATIITTTTPACAITVSETLEGMTLDAPIRPFHQGLVTKLPA